ncbi:MAG: ATP-binding protein [Rikenellaceae bacterium]|nr:ATP-binding protein [Rikenellaceae bacterium]
MKKRTIPYRRIILAAVAIAASAALIVVAYFYQVRSLLILSVPILLLSVWRLLAIYKDIMKRINLVFEVIEGNDTLRLTDNPEYTDNAMVNFLLNRIMEVMNNVRHQIIEKERYVELIMECANIGIVTIRDNGAVEQTNSKVVNLFGLRRFSHIDQLRPQSEMLADTLMNIKSGEQRVVRYVNETGEMTLSIGCSLLKQGERRLRVITIGDVNNMLNQKEQESWDKLTRILTHEIMNSLAPVTSISHTLLNSQLDEERVQDGLQTIHSTSERLLSFVHSFRQVTRIPTPQRSPLLLTELVKHAVSILEWDEVECSVEIVPAETMVYVDRTLMAQVLVNILKNAQEALASRRGERWVRVNSRLDISERIIIDISSNSGPIADEIVENIFTPFFSTKPNGSGIGLAFSRQVVRMHGGALYLSANTPDKVTFTMVLE